MNQAALKVAPAHRKDAREALAAAIKQKAEVDTRATVLATNFDRLSEEVLVAVERVEQARAAIDDARKDIVTHLVDPTTPAPRLTVREASQAAEDAETALADLRAARDRCGVEFEALKNSIAFSAMNVGEAISTVVAEDPATRALVDLYRRRAAEVEAMRRALEFLSSTRALPAEFARWWSIEPSSEREQAWRGAWQTLANDADAPLPTEAT